MTAGGLDEPARAAGGRSALAGAARPLRCAGRLAGPPSPRRCPGVGGPATPGRGAGRGARAAVHRRRCGHRRRRSPRPAGHPARARRRPGAAAAVEQLRPSLGPRELGLLVLLGATLARPRLPRPAAGWAPLAAGAALAWVRDCAAGALGHGPVPPAYPRARVGGPPRRGSDLGGVPRRPRRSAGAAAAPARPPGSRPVRCCSGLAPRPPSASRSWS